MDSQKAETTITLSALVTGGIFAYRKLTEPGVPEGTTRSKTVVEDYRAVFGAGPPLEWGQWVKAAGILFIGVSILGAASPDIGGSLALLIGTTAVLGNGLAIARDLKRTEGNTAEKQMQQKFETPGAFLPKGKPSTINAAIVPTGNNTVTAVPIHDIPQVHLGGF